MSVAIVMGSKSDLEVVKKAMDVLKKFDVPFEARVLSAHRSPSEAAQFAQQADKRGIKVLIAAAGKAAHLGGVLAGHTTLPVIGLPIKSSMMDGLDSLLSTVQMPDGVPVATVAVNGAVNAALLAVQILALQDGALAKRLVDYKQDMRQAVLAADAELQKEIN